MVETGANIGGTYSETVTGNENYTVTESDNGFTDTSERTITGSGTYTHGYGFRSDFAVELRFLRLRWTPLSRPKTPIS